MLYKNLISKIKYLITDTYSNFNSAPIIIVGNHKSGSTAIANLIAHATGKTLTPDILRVIKFPETILKLKYKLITYQDFFTTYRTEFSKDIIKDPLLTAVLDDLVELLTDAKFLFLVRDPRDNIRSILNRLRIPGNLDKIDFDNYTELIKSPVWKLALDSSWFGVNSNNYIESLANRWVFEVSKYIENRDKVLLYKYEDFRADKINSIKSLTEQLNLNYKNDISHLVNEQFQSKGYNKLSWEDFFGNNLARIESICKKSILELDYPLKQLSNDH